MIEEQTIRTRVVGLAALMVVLAASLHVVALSLPDPVDSLRIPWWVVAVGLVAAEMLRVPMHARRHPHAVSVTEIPLILGVVSLAPLPLIATRVLSSAVVQPFRQPRPEPRRIAFNLALVYLEVATVLAVYRGLIGEIEPTSVAGIIVALVALLAAITVGVVMVAAVLVLTQPEATVASTATSLSVTLGGSALAAILAVAGLALASYEPLALLVIAIAAGGLLWMLRMHGSMSARLEDLEATYRFTSVMDAAETADDVVDVALRQLVELFGAASAEVVMARGVGSSMVRIDGPTSAPVRKPAPPNALEALTAGHHEIGTGARSLSEAPEALRSHYEERGIGSGIVATLPGDGGTATMLFVESRSAVPPSEAEVRLFDALARQSRVAFERVWLLDRLRREVRQKEHQTLHDSLTGLPNRLQFTIVVDEALRRATASGTSMGVVLVDLDRFKEINDTLGHQRGDTLLQQVASRLGSATGMNGHLARLGGDEFGVVIRSVEGVVDALEEARRFAEALDPPFSADGLTVQITASIGVALAPEHGSDGASLLRHAEIAMYEAKDSASGLQMYDSQMDRYSTRSLALAAELKQAIGSGAIGVHYQPKVRIPDGTVVGVEALSRWHHPVHGRVTPDEFIALAERTGVIRLLTEQVMRTALRDAVRLRDEGHEISVAVNVATSSLMDAEFPGLVATLIGETGVDPQSVVLEVTESKMMTDTPRARRVLESLDETGVELSIDDFGTGYSSLSYLNTLPVDEVKIDRSFVSGTAGDRRLASIVRATTSLGHSLDLRVVAEGVEDAVTWDLLARAGCDVAQGFFIARPMPYTDLLAWMSAGGIADGLRGPRAIND